MPRRTPPFRYLLVPIGVILMGAAVWSTSRDGQTRPYAEDRWGAFGGDPDLGPPVLEAYGCGACHVIPGVRGAMGRVGPKLEDLHEQVYIAGVVPNTPEHLVSWIMDPQAHSPNSAMPDLAVTESDARHMAAYLLREQVGAE